MVQGFTHRFDIGYRGPEDIVHTAQNIPLRVGSPTELWNKIMSEVGEKRFAGPYKREQLLMLYFKQSPIGLVPKANDKMRLIFHLSYNFGEDWRDRSFNFRMPDHMCSVKYNDLDHTVHNCLRILEHMEGQGQIFYAKSDCSHAFQIIPALVQQRKFLVMMAYHLVTKEQFYFIDLCLPFSASISCALFQAFSDALKHITEFKLLV